MYRKEVFLGEGGLGLSIREGGGLNEGYNHHHTRCEVLDALCGARQDGVFRRKGTRRSLGGWLQRGSIAGEGWLRALNSAVSHLGIEIIRTRSSQTVTRCSQPVRGMAGGKGNWLQRGCIARKEWLHEWVRTFVLKLSFIRTRSSRIVTRCSHR